MLLPKIVRGLPSDESRNERRITRPLCIGVVFLFLLTAFLLPLFKARLAFSSRLIDPSGCLSWTCRRTGHYSGSDIVLSAPNLSYVARGTGTSGTGSGQININIPSGYTEVLTDEIYVFWSETWQDSLGSSTIAISYDRGPVRETFNLTTSPFYTGSSGDWPDGSPGNFFSGYYVRLGNEISSGKLPPSQSSYTFDITVGDPSTTNGVGILIPYLDSTTPSVTRTLILKPWGEYFYRLSSEVMIFDVGGYEFNLLGHIKPVFFVSDAEISSIDQPKYLWWARGPNTNRPGDDDLISGEYGAFQIPIENDISGGCIDNYAVCSKEGSKWDTITWDNLTLKDGVDYDLDCGNDWVAFQWESPDPGGDSLMVVMGGILIEEPLPPIALEGNVSFVAAGAGWVDSVNPSPLQEYECTSSNGGTCEISFTIPPGGEAVFNRSYIFWNGHKLDIKPDPQLIDITINAGGEIFEKENVSASYTRKDFYYNDPEIWSRLYMNTYGVKISDIFSSPSLPSDRGFYSFAVSKVGEYKESGGGVSGVGIFLPYSHGDLPYSYIKGMFLGEVAAGNQPEPVGRDLFDPAIFDLPNSGNPLFVKPLIMFAGAEGLSESRENYIYWDYGTSSHDFCYLNEDGISPVLQYPPANYAFYAREGLRWDTLNAVSDNSTFLTDDNQWEVPAGTRKVGFQVESPNPNGDSGALVFAAVLITENIPPIVDNSWFQVDGGDVHANFDGGVDGIVDPIPSETSPSQLILNSENPSMGGGIASASRAINLGEEGGAVGPDGYDWRVENYTGSGFLNPDEFSSEFDNLIEGIIDQHRGTMTGGDIEFPSQDQLGNYNDKKLLWIRPESSNTVTISGSYNNIPWTNLVILIGDPGNISTPYNLRVDSDFTLTDQGAGASSILFIVTGDLNISGDIDSLDGFFLVKGTIHTGYDYISDNPSSTQLLARGSWVAENGFDFSARDLGAANSTTPSELVIFKPRYLMMLQSFVGEGHHSWREI